ncbi:MAG: class I SAM-dependent methyltransferase, partial [Deinococcus sp.]|nr:class I SAM-dependent methyltransferase [Deinococcus sp.]
MDKLPQLIMEISSRLPFTSITMLRAMLSKKAESLLDVGCGTGLSTQLLLKGRLLRAVGYDGHGPYLVAAKERGFYAQVVQGDVRALPFREKEFDIVLCSHVIEHLSQTEGLALLERIEQIARLQVIVAAPVGFLPQDEFDDNPYQQHRSAWFPKDFLDRGYRVVGHSIRFLVGDLNIVKLLGFLSVPILGLSWLLQPIPYLFPSL